MHSRDQTIFALSSGRPPCAIAIVRLSGPKAGPALEWLAGELPPPRIATRALLREPEHGAIDEALVLWFPGPGSANGEDIVEFHLHGGRAVVLALFGALSRLPDIRPAEPGEFTRRAFENGKLDLTEAEALDDLIHADTDRQRRQALRQLHGLLGERAATWRRQIVEACALVEAGIDFVEEPDVPADLIGPVLTRVARLRDEIEDVLAAQGRGERLREGLVVAIAGPPNVGKSTLMNQLARREVAIVSPQAGTTRDIIEVHLDLDGFPVTVIDTAGIRETADPVEQEGVRRARARAAEADLVLWMVADGSTRAELAGGVPVWTLRNKIDLDGQNPYAVALRIVAANSGRDEAELGQQYGGAQFGISARDGQGVPELIAALVRFAGEFFGGSDDALIGRARQRELLRDAADMLQRAIDRAGSGDELVAEELRSAALALGRLLGRVDIEDVLGAIFSKFCVGK